MKIVLNNFYHGSIYQLIQNMGQKYSVKNNSQTSKPWFILLYSYIVLLSIIKIDVKNTRSN